MSFQGDVAGIGLGELLQGLARGGRDGTLTLQGHKLTASLGWKSGLLYVLAHEEEDGDLWSRRAAMAFADVQEDGLETLRRQTIARAQRIENFYAMLDAPNLHFRFEPGALPLQPQADVNNAVSPGASEGDAERSDTTEQLWGPGWTVQHLLLEHARICDEIKTGPGSRVCGFDLPLALDSGSHPPQTRNFLEHCDGLSTAQEIADRLGWPLSRCRATLGEHLQAGIVHSLDPAELLAASLREMAMGRAGRAAVRLRGWIRRSPAGPMSRDNAEKIIDAWRKERLEPVFHALDAAMGRRLLRKIKGFDHHADEMHGLWRALQHAHRGDPITSLHEIVLRLGEVETPDTRAFKDLLHIARNFQDSGRPGRTRTLLRLAASYLPERPQTRVEIGRRMLEADLIDEGVRWLLETADKLIDSDPEGAMFPLRAVLRVKPEHPKANALKERARNRETQRKRQRRGTMIGLSLGLVLSLVAFVRYRGHREVEHWIDEANTYADPTLVLKLLEEKFGPNPPERIVELRSTVARRKKSLDMLAYQKWMATYDAAEEASRFGDPLLGLQRTLELPPHPDIPSPVKFWPETQELYGLLSVNLERRSVEVDVSIEAGLEELQPEEHFTDLMTDLLAILPIADLQSEARPFRFRVAQLLTEVLERREFRAKKRVGMKTEEKEREQDILLATARAHERAGDLERSLLAYERLFATDEGLSRIPELKREIRGVRAHWNAAQTALELAAEGRHAEASRTLRRVCPRPIEHLLAFHVDSVPRGARVTLRAGRERKTPFVTRAGVGEELELVFQLDGFLDQTIKLTEPRNLVVHLYRFPERHWSNAHRIEAVPVSSGNAHILADRFGRVRRIDADSEPLWELQLNTLGGIARTPTFLPEKPGWLLLVSEDGQAWLIHAEDGESLGPYLLGALPVDGPTLGPHGVRLLLDDGRIARWSSDVEPRFIQADRGGEFLPESAGHEPGSYLVVRNGLNSGTGLESPWNDWSVEVRDTDYLVFHGHGMGFTAERNGQWVFLAWEAPTAFAPQGRFWLSDEAGLRSYLPDMNLLIDLGSEK